MLKKTVLAFLLIVLTPSAFALELTNNCGDGHNITIFYQQNIQESLTAINRTISYSTNIPIYYAYWSDANNITYTVSYNQDNFSIMDHFISYNHQQGGFINLEPFSVPGANTYSVTFTSTNSSGDTCDLYYTFGTKELDPNNVKLVVFAILLLTGIGLVIIIFYTMDFQRKAKGDYIG